VLGVFLFTSGTITINSIQYTRTQCEEDEDEAGPSQTGDDQNEVPEDKRDMDEEEIDTDMEVEEEAATGVGTGGSVGDGMEGGGEDFKSLDRGDFFFRLCLVL